MSGHFLSDATPGRNVTGSPHALRTELVRLLTVSPGATVRELAQRLRSQGLSVTRYDINSRLYSDRGLFRRDGVTPPTWHIVPGAALSSIPDIVLRQELVLALTLHPGATARELVGHLRMSGPQVTKTTVNRKLYAGRELFWNNGATPPRWQVMSGLALAPVPQMIPSPKPLDDRFALYAWQAEALTAWRDRGRKGVVEAVTGTGKTMVGLAAAWEELQHGGRVEVLVPSIELLNQWAELVKEYFPQHRLGLLGGGNHDRLSKVDVLVAVVNSARTVQADAGGRHALLVADECHRYASERNSEALDETYFEARLGLSATYGRTDDRHLDVLDPFFGGTCFELDYSRAIADEVTAHFKVALVGVRFNEDEKLEYEEVDERARRLRRWLINHAEVSEEPFGAFMADVSRLAEGGQGEATGKARMYLNAFSRRRQILADTSAKLDLLDELAPAVRYSERVIVFTERKKAAEQAAATLNWQGIRAGAVHSGLPTDTRRDLLSQFAQGRLTVLCAPKILDEGIDVPAADLGIILSASQSRRQMIQRMGRVLRRKSDGRFARFVIAYVEGTSEDPKKGAHGAFLEEITAVADHVCDFGAIEMGDEACEYLNEYVWKRPIPQPRMAPR